MLVRHLSNVAATDKRRQLVNLLTAFESDVGLIISERIIKLAPRTAEPIYQDLANDVKKAQNKNLPFNFTHYAIISKVWVPSDPKIAQMMGKMGVTYSNDEEEFFVPEWDFILDTKIFDEESKSEDILVQKKRSMVFRAEKLDKIVNIICETVGSDAGTGRARGANQWPNICQISYF